MILPFLVVFILCDCTHTLLVDDRVSYKHINLKKSETFCVKPKHPHLFLVLHFNKETQISVVNSNSESIEDSIAEKLDNNRVSIFLRQFGQISFTANTDESSVSFVAMCVPNACSTLWYTNVPDTSFIMNDYSEKTTCVLFGLKDVLEYNVTADLKNRTNTIKIISENEKDQTQPQKVEVLNTYPVESLIKKLTKGYFEISISHKIKGALTIHPLNTKDLVSPNVPISEYIRISSRYPFNISPTTLLMYATVVIMIGTITTITIIFLRAKKRKQRKLTSGSYKSVNLVNLDDLESM
ncbi:hypothetical protein TRFO_11445 [Tritrichomonas foetus]|uniref:Uncharacterized protein n=1 Tax=Tritrichomonas foetus TaxID=1144522 RepID=A0A1J4J9Q2_9EUKA|nr:hypothetical protein TRFO_11445 [Tritrichomonas foetus]|eukprot:OHS93972.1 hypothetical protein TRFO_11445 [Tritrichomonas foetus]